MQSFKRLFILIALISVTLSGCGTMAKKSQNFYFGNYSEAEQHFAKGEYKEAIEKYSAYRLENPDGNLAIIALYYMAKSYQATGQNEKAIEAYNIIVRDHPDVVWANFSNAQLKELSAA